VEELLGEDSSSEASDLALVGSSSIVGIPLELKNPSGPFSLGGLRAFVSNQRATDSSAGNFDTPEGFSRVIDFSRRTSFAGAGVLRTLPST
jgi:hypothetical protein